MKEYFSLEDIQTKTSGWWTTVNSRNLTPLDINICDMCVCVKHFKKGRGAELLPTVIFHAFPDFCDSWAEGSNLNLMCSCQVPWREGDVSTCWSYLPEVWQFAPAKATETQKGSRIVFQLPTFIFQGLLLLILKSVTHANFPRCQHLSSGLVVQETIAGNVKRRVLPICR